MQKNVFKLVFLLFLVFGFGANTLAQPPEDFDRSPTKEQMEKVRERIETLRMWKLTKTLDLDEKTSAKLFPLLNKYDKKRAEIEKAIRDDLRELREALKGKREGNLKSIIDKLEENHEALQRINDEERAELKKILTIEQQAKFILFQQEFDRDIRKTIAEARERHHGRFGKGSVEEPLPPERP
jgi:Spy/CpxP family protein refolding chaperone